MAALYPLGKQAFLSASINLTSDTINVALVSATYTYSAAHQYYSSVAGAVGTPVTLSSITVNSPNPGVFNAANATFTSVSGSAVNALVIYKSTGTAGTSPLIAYIDGVSVTPNGGNITVQWDSGSNRIFSL